MLYFMSNIFFICTKNYGEYIGQGVENQRAQFFVSCFELV